MIENWIKIIDFDYEISSFGRVRSLDRIVRNRWGNALKKGKLISPRKDKDGYVRVCLYKEGLAIEAKIHRLVAKYFLPEPPKEFNLINHKDFNRNNNIVENLEWVDHKTNSLYSKVAKRFLPNRGKKLTLEIAK